VLDTLVEAKDLLPQVLHVVLLVHGSTQSVVRFPGERHELLDAFIATAILFPIITSAEAGQRLHGVIELVYLQVLIRRREGLVKINNFEVVVATRAFQDSRKIQTLPLTVGTDFGRSAIDFVL
jgi:hypothetical protein